MADGDATPFLEVDDTNGQKIGPTDPTQDGEFLQRLVGEDKKYKTPDDVAKAYVHATDFIDQLKTEKASLQEEMEALKQHQVLQEDLNTKIERLEAATTQQEAVPPELVERLVNASLSKAEAKKKEAAAKVYAWGKLDEFYGDRAGAVDAVRKYVGDDQEMARTLTQLGVANPDAFIKLVTNEQPKQTPEGVITEVESTMPKPDVELAEIAMGLTWSKASKIRKDDPELYKSRKFQLMLHKLAAENPNFMTT